MKWLLFPAMLVVGALLVLTTVFRHGMRHFSFLPGEAFPGTAEQRDMEVPAVVMIDPGHGGTDPGAVSSSGIEEADLGMAQK